MHQTFFQASEEGGVHSETNLICRFTFGNSSASAMGLRAVMWPRTWVLKNPMNGNVWQGMNRLEENLVDGNALANATLSIEKRMNAGRCQFIQLMTFLRHATVTAIR